MNQNLKGLIKIMSVVVSGSVLLMVNHTNHQLDIKNNQIKTQIEHINANTQTANKHHHNIIEQLPNTYAQIRQAGNQVIQLQMKLTKVNPQVDTQKYNALISQLKGYLGQNISWNAASPWLPNASYHMKLVFGGLTTDTSAYKVGFQLLDKHNHMIGFMQSLYANNRFNNVTSFYTAEGSKILDGIARKYEAFASKSQQYAAYKNAKRLQQKYETEHAGSKGD